ncbi:MAG: hypothetical protein ACE5KM_21620 [Planctomycetaceae bacterium]
MNGLNQSQQQRLNDLMNKYATAGPGKLTPAELLDFGELHGKTARDGSDLFSRELYWWWAAERGLNSPTAVGELLRAAKARYGAVPKGLEQQLRDTFVGLPAQGRGVYRKPAYVPADPVAAVRLSPGVGKPRLGPNFMSGMSRLSDGSSTVVNRAAIVDLRGRR